MPDAQAQPRYETRNAPKESVAFLDTLSSAVDSGDETAGAAVGKDEIVKGYEYRKGEYVLIEPSELENLKVPSKHTIDVTQCSQYEQHVRAICALPLSPPELLSNAIMMNILGDGNGDRLDGVNDLLSDPAIVLHMYGKRHAVAGRKMGHFTMLIDGPLDDAAIAKARAAHAKLRWRPVHA